MERVETANEAYRRGLEEAAKWHDKMVATLKKQSKKYSKAHPQIFSNIKIGIHKESAAAIRKLSAAPLASAHGDELGCADCGRLYGDEHGFPDLVLPDEAWNKISPRHDGNGVLCPSCICKRAHDAGLDGVQAVFRSGPFAHGDEGVVVPVVSVQEMKTSAGPDYFVSIKCGDRELTPYSFKIKGRAEFSAAEFQWLLNGGEKPDLSDWLDRTAITAITGVK